MSSRPSSVAVPPPDAPAVTPDIVLSRLFGWTAECCRPGCGGGYINRTLTGSTPKPFLIDTGLHAARLTKLYPQPHDIPLDLILTENAISAARDVT